MLEKPARARHRVVRQGVVPRRAGVASSKKALHHGALLGLQPGRCRVELDEGEQCIDAAAVLKVESGGLPVHEEKNFGPREGR